MVDQPPSEGKHNENCQTKSIGASTCFDELVRSSKIQNIVIITSELKRNQKSQNVINNALALIYQGHKVRIITSDVDEECWEEEMSKLFIKVIKSWVPLSLCGFFQNELRIIRTVLMAFWTTAYSTGRQRPMIIMTDTCAISMPILKMFGNFKIIYFQYFFQLENLPSTKYLLSISPTWVQNWAMKYADDVVVQNLECAKIFSTTFKNVKIPRILYPCIDIGTMEREECINISKIIQEYHSDDTVFYLVTGPYLPRSNFELAIESFDILITKLQRKGLRKLPLLIIAGKFCELEESQLMYHAKILDLISNVCCPANIVLLRKFTPPIKKTLLTYCSVVLHTTINEIFGNQILEAMFMEKPIIACNDGVALEYLNSECGILVKPNTSCFSDAMYMLFRDKVMCDVLGLEAKKYFKANFSFSKYTSILNAYLEHLNPRRVRNCVFMENGSDVNCNVISKF